LSGIRTCLDILHEYVEYDPPKMMELTTTPSTSLRKLAGIAAVVALHGALIYALLSGLAVKTIATLQQPIMARLIPEAKPPVPPEIKHEAPKPPPRPQPVEHRVHVPVPEIKATSAAPAVLAAVVNTPAPPVSVPEPVPPAAPPAAPVRTAATVDASQDCQAPEYPDRSRDAEEEGTVTLRLLIEPDGHVSSSAIGVSSGHARLDEAAREALSRCLFKPGTVDGKPQQSWATLKYVWKLQ
jgi:periplasmic protein TonB